MWVILFLRYVVVDFGGRKKYMASKKKDIMRMRLYIHVVHINDQAMAPLRILVQANVLGVTGRIQAVNVYQNKF